MGAQVTLLDDSDDLRTVLIHILGVRLNIRCLGLRNKQDLLSHADEVLSSQIVLLDINLGTGKWSGVDAFYWLQKQQFRGMSVFLTGHGSSHPLVVRAKGLGVQILQKPVPTHQLLALVQNSLVARGEGTPA